MTDKQLYLLDQFILDITMAVYDHFDVDSAPSSQKEYNEMVDYIVEVIRKTNWWDLLTYECVDYADDINAHMVADAFYKVLNEQR